MEQLYWITVISSLDIAFKFLCGISALSFIIALSISVCSYVYEHEKHWGFPTLSAILLFVNVVGAMFTPNKAELLTIYGIGTTIDYIRENPTAQELPDKCIKMLDAMADKWIDDNSKQTEQ